MLQILLPLRAMLSQNSYHLPCPTGGPWLLVRRGSESIHRRSLDPKSFRDSRFQHLPPRAQVIPGDPTRQSQEVCSEERHVVQNLHDLFRIRDSTVPNETDNIPQHLPLPYRDEHPLADCTVRKESRRDTIIERRFKGKFDDYLGNTGGRRCGGSTVGYHG
jgi:hypothetical protein